LLSQHILRRTPLPRTRVNKGTKRRREDQSGNVDGYLEAATLGLESGVVTSVPQLPHFEATSSLGGFVMDHWALLMIKDPESRRTHCSKPLYPVSLGASTTLVL
jgi:hypothetical protein